MSLKPLASYSSTRVRKNGGVDGSTPPHTSACCAHFTAWRSRGDDALLHALGERGLEAGEALGHERDALRDRLPLLLGVARHEVEGHPHVLHRAPEDAEVAQALAGVVLLERELEPLAHHRRRRCGRRRRDDRGGGERAQRGAVVLGALVDPVGGVVGHLVVVAGDALAGRRERIEGGEALDVGVGELVDVRLAWAHRLRARVARPAT